MRSGPGDDPHPDIGMMLTEHSVVPENGWAGLMSMLPMSIASSHRWPGFRSGALLPRNVSDHWCRKPPFPGPVSHTRMYQSPASSSPFNEHIGTPEVRICGYGTGNE